MAFVDMDGGRVRADEAFAGALAALRLDTLDGVFAYAGKGFSRTHANRDNFHIVEAAGGRVYDLFLKRHRGVEPKEFLKLLAARSPFMTAGRREWANIMDLAALGIPTMRPAAFGQRRFLGFERRSFLITEKIPDAVPADDYIRERYSGPLSPEALKEKRALLRDIGRLAGKFHAAGYTHMDFYLNHIFVRAPAAGERALHLIDLQRVARRWLARRRWVIKDLAALLYSTRGLPLSCTDAARIFTAYFDPSTPRKHRRRIMRQSLARAARMAGHRVPF